LGNGALIVDAAPGGPADRGGLQPGDVITGIDNHPVQSPADFNAVLAGLHAGQQVQINYEQGPLSYTTQVSLQARPSGP
jgi:S1-C subfamily serine protease